MANIMDYLVWRGEFGFDAAPWNEVDALMMANLSYLDFHGLGDERGWTLADAKRLELVQDTDVANFEGRKQQFLAMADTVRFGDIRMHHFISLTDEDEELQFSATCYDLPDGTLCIAFRGTDGTLVGWREDFNMSWQSVVPAQEAAVYYLEKAAELDDRPLCLVGHSKGGNLAAYAAACSRPEVQDRLKAVYSFDGPGMSPDIFQSGGYQRVVDRIHSFVPQTAIVGMMMEYHRKYTVVKSDASGIAQHDPLTWQVYGPRFETAEKIDSNAVMVSETLHGLLEQTGRKERGKMVDTLFGLMANTKAASLSEMKEGGLKTLTGVARGTLDLTPDARKALTRLAGLFLSLGFGSLADRYRPGQRHGEEKPDPEADDPGENGDAGAENKS